MGKIVISENVSLDGVIQDPDGEEGFRLGGWFGQFGGKDLEAWAEVSLEEALRADALLLGRRSDEWFAARWAARSGEWADRLNSLPKYVVSSTLEDARLEQLDGPRRRRRERGVEAEAGARRRDRRLRELSAGRSADRARPGRRAAADRSTRSCSERGSACSARRATQKRMRLLDSRTVGNGLAYLTYEVVRAA